MPATHYRAQRRGGSRGGGGFRGRGGRSDGRGAKRNFGRAFGAPCWSHESRERWKKPKTEAEKIRESERKQVEEWLSMTQGQVNKALSNGEKPNKKTMDYLNRLKSDVQYIVHFPSDQEYIPLLKKLDNEEDAKRINNKRENIRHQIRRELEILAGGNEVTESNKESGPKIVNEGEEAEEKLEFQKDDFFLYSDDEEDEEKMRPAAPLTEVPPEADEEAPSHSKSSNNEKMKANKHSNAGKNDMVTRRNKWASDQKDAKSPINGDGGHKKVFGSVGKSAGDQNAQGGNVKTDGPLRSRAEGGRKRRKKKK